MTINSLAQNDDVFRDSISVILGCKLNGPNLIPNGSFEDTVCCPITLAGLTCTPPWFNANAGDADFRHQCCPPASGCEVPGSGSGYQYPSTGDGYVGFWTYQMGTNGREYVEYPLSKPLIQGRKYCVGFYVNPFNILSPIDALHAVLSTDSITNYTNALNLPYTPDIANPSGNIIDDTLNWTLVSGYYTAQGGEKFITVGNFYPDSMTNLGTGWDPNTSFSYYYCDDVFIYDCEEPVQDTVGEIFFIPNAFSPNGDGENDLFFVQGNLTKLHCEIYNRWGEKVAELTEPNESWDGTFSGEKCNTGVYVYSLNAKDKDGKEIVRQGNVTLLR